MNMSTIIDRVARDLFDGQEVVRDIKFCYRRETSAEQLADYRSRAIAQIRGGQSRENTELDRHLMG